MLEIKNVSKSYADKRVLHHIDLRLSHGIYALLGVLCVARVCSAAAGTV